MAVSAVDVLIALKARDDASAELNKVHGALSNLGNTAVSVGRVLAVGLAAGTAAVAAGLGASANAAAGFEQTMSGVKAVSGATADQMVQLSQKALALGKATVFSASEAGQGIEELVKSGISIEDVMGGAAEATLALASAGGVDLVTAATIASNALNGFNLQGADMAHVSDLIAGAANASAIDVNQFGLALSQSAAVASTVGLSFDDLSVAIAEMGNAGIKGSDAGTSLKTMLLNLSPATKLAKAEMMELGIITADGANRFFDATGSARSLAEIQQVLQDATKDLTDEQRLQSLQTIFGTDAIRAAAVMAKNGAEGFDTLAASMAKVTAESVAAERLNNLKGDLEQLKGSVETAAITLGLALLPALRDAAHAATDFVNGLIPFIESQGPAMVAMLQGAGAGVVTFAGQLRDNASGALQAIADKLAEAGAAWAPWAAQAGPAGEAVSASLTGVSGMVQSLQLLLQGNFAGAFATAGTAMGDFGKAIDSLRIAFDLLIPQVDRDEIWKNLGDAVGSLKDAFMLLWPEIQKTGEHTGTTAESAGSLSATLKDLSAGVKDVAATVGPIVQVFIDIGAALDAVKANGDDLSHSIRGNWIGEFQAWGDKFSILGSTIQAAGQTLQELGVIAGIAFDALGTSARSGLDQLGTSIGTFFSGLGSDVQAGLALIRGFFTDTWNAIPEDIRADLELVTNLIVVGIATWLASVTDTMTAIGASISGGWAAISAAVGAAMSSLGSAVQTAWQAITGSTTTAMAENTASVSTGWNDVLTVTQTAWTAITDAIGGALATAVAAVTVWVGQVIAAVQGLAGEMGKAGAAAGQAVVDGLTGALTSGIRLVGDKATELARSTLEAAKSALGASSPSKRFAEIGQDIVDGLIQGIEENTPAVGAAMTGSLKSAMSGLQAGAGGAFLTVPQFGSAIRAMGFNENTISAICGPIAAQGIAEGLGKSVSLIDVEAISTKIGAYAKGAGTFGSGAFQKILSAIGIDSRSGSFQEAVDAAMAGIPVAISTPLHYFLAQGFDQATQQFVVGNTGTALKAGAEKMTRAAIEGVAGAATFIIPKVEAAGVALRGLAGDITSSFTTAAPAAVDKFTTLITNLARDVDTASDNIATKMADIAEKVSSGVAKATSDGANQIANAMRSAQDQLDSLGGALADPTSTTVKQSGLAGEISAAKALHAQQRADADQLFSHQQDLTRANSQFQKDTAKAAIQLDRDLARAKTDLERSGIIGKAADAQAALNEAHKLQIDSLDTAFAQKVADNVRTRALDAADRAFNLAEDAKMVKFREAAIIAERDAKILLAKQATTDRLAEIQIGADKERAILKQSYIDKLADLKTGLLDKLPGLSGEAAVIVNTLFDEISTKAAGVTGTITSSMGTAAEAAEGLATTYGISLDDASKIVNDHGKVAKAVFGVDGIIPDNIRLTDTAVEDYADGLKISWDTARTVLNSSGTLAKVVLGTTIPVAAKEATSALIATGNAAGSPIATPFSQLKKTAADLATGGLDVARKAGLDLTDMFPGLTTAVDGWIDKLGEIPTEIKTTITTEFQTSGAAAGSGNFNPSGGLGGIGSSGPGQGSARSGTVALPSGNDPGSVAARDAFRSEHPDMIVGRNDDGSIYAEKRAGGGPVSAGRLYQVNENRRGATGVELFMPSMNGSISPRGGGGGSGGGIDYDRLAAALARAIASQPAPRVALEDVRSGIARIGGRNGGVAGLA